MSPMVDRDVMNVKTSLYWICTRIAQSVQRLGYDPTGKYDTLGYFPSSSSSIPVAPTLSIQHP
jgi:hypothetical protein